MDGGDGGEEKNRGLKLGQAGATAGILAESQEAGSAGRIIEGWCQLTTNVGRKGKPIPEKSSSEGRDGESNWKKEKKKKAKRQRANQRSGG